MFKNFPLFPVQASQQAGQVDAVYFFLVAVTAFFSLLIATLIIVFTVKYRRRHKDEIGVPIHGSLPLELLWTIIPFVIVMIMFGWGAKVFFHLYRPPAGAMGSTSSASSGCGRSSTSAGSGKSTSCTSRSGGP
jgi:cytochrome c oxidase subunit 2